MKTKICVRANQIALFDWQWNAEWELGRKTKREGKDENDHWINLKSPPITPRDVEKWI